MPVGADELIDQAWHEAGDLFDARERAALVWAETVTRVAETAIPDAAFSAASSVFSEKELADLTVAIRFDERLQSPRHRIS